MRLEVDGDSFAITVRVAGANDIEELVGIHSCSGNVYDALAHQIHSFPGHKRRLLMPTLLYATPRGASFRGTCVKV